MTVFQEHLYNDPAEGFLQPNPHTAMLLSPFGCIYQPTSPFCSHWTNLPRN